jgi:hypothetical protein
LLMRPIGPVEESEGDEAGKEKESETPPAAV